MVPISVADPPEWEKTLELVEEVHEVEGALVVLAPRLNLLVHLLPHSSHHPL